LKTIIKSIGRREMKKLFMTLLLTFTFSTINYSAVYANNCVALADVCYAKCDQRFGGDTFWDGAARVICKSGCVIAEVHCQISVMLQ
jgi:hypothetical protein